MEGQIIHDFNKIKERRMMRAKNKSTSPSHTFPIALKLSKSSNKAEKVDMRYGGSGIK